MTIDRMSGTAGAVEITFLGMPSLGCPQSHERRCVDPDFGSWLAPEVWDRIPKSSTKGFGGKRHSCAKCGTPLEPAAAQRGLIAVPLELRKGGPFRLEIHANVMRCPSCRHEQLSPQLESGLFDAMVNAFQTAKFG